jgi:hypothetical protein
MQRPRRSLRALEVVKYEAMRKKVGFQNTMYDKTGLRPNIYFYRFLAPLPDVPQTVVTRIDRLELWVPNTIVYDGISSPFWIYSKAGRVYRADNYTQAQAVSRFGSHNRHELVAIAKTVLPSCSYDRSTGRVIGQEIEMLTTEGLKERLKGVSYNKERVALQMYVKSKGRKAFICRSVWTRDKMPFCFIITNNVSDD